MDLLIGIIGGAILSWVITHYYYLKSSIQPPEWAKPIIAKLPKEPPTKEKLVELFQEALDAGEAEFDPIFGYVRLRQKISKRKASGMITPLSYTFIAPIAAGAIQQKFKY
jgi:hypothetical protein